MQLDARLADSPTDGSEAGGPAAVDGAGGADSEGGAGGDRDALIAAIDIGGTKIAGALVDPDGTLLVTARRPTPRQDGGEVVMAAVAAVVDELRAAAEWSRVVAVGIGSAGPIDAKRGTVSPVNIPGWREFPLVAGVATHLGGALPVVLSGDGPAMTAAEHWLGAARGRRDALCMVVSTGVGGGLVLGGRLHPGPTGNAGHIGHISVELDGELCPCGSRGCVEIIASGTSIARRALREGWQSAGEDTSAAAVAKAAERGDAIALASFDRAAKALAAGIAATAALVELEVVVIGGGVAQSGPLLFDPLRKWLDLYASLPYVRGLEVLPAELGTDAGIVGAAAAAAEHLGLTAFAPATSG
jgi:glucokinase